MTVFATNPTIHVFFAGRACQVSTAALPVDPDASLDDIRRALAQHLDLEPGRLDDCRLDRLADGDITLRPAMAFG